MSSPPVFLLVPGNFLPASYYATTVQLLKSAGFQSRFVSLPSTGSKTPLTSNAPDILAIRAILEELSDLGQEIIVVAHSYGAIPTCEAVKDLEKHGNLGVNKPGGVIRLVFIAAWLLQEGENPPQIIEKSKIESSWARFEGGNLYADDPTYAFHHDTSAEAATYWAPLTTHSDMTAFATPLKYAAWRYIPTTYVLCESHRCIPLRAQESMVASTEGKVRNVRLSSGHVPMLSMPERLVDILTQEAT